MAKWDMTSGLCFEERRAELNYFVPMFQNFGDLFLAYSYRTHIDPSATPHISIFFLLHFIYKFRNIGTNKRLTYINQRLTSVPNLFQMFQNWLFVPIFPRYPQPDVTSSSAAILAFTDARQHASMLRRPKDWNKGRFLFQFFHFCSNFSNFVPNFLSYL